MWRWGFLPPLPPQWPLALCVSQWNRAPQGSTSSPTNKQHTHTSTRVAFMVSAGAATHSEAYKVPRCTLRKPRKGMVLFLRRKRFRYCCFAVVRPNWEGGNLSKDLDSCFKRQVRSVFDCSLLELEDLDSARCARTFRAGNYCNLILSEGTTEEKLVLLLSVRVFQGEKQRELEWPCDS